MLLTNRTNNSVSTPVKSVSISAFTSQTTNRITQNALYLLGKRHSEEDDRPGDSDVEEAFEGLCSVFQRETGSFRYLYLYKHLDHKHLKHHR